MIATIRRRIGSWIAGYLNHTISKYEPFSAHDVPVLEKFLKPGDVLLVEGNTRISTAIKYLTQSTWSHSAIFVGDSTGVTTESGETCPLVEAELSRGVIASPLSKYRHFNTRICRPVGLSQQDCEKVVGRIVGSLGKDYDLKHIVDLARYLFPTPPVPVKFRRRMLAFGSNDPSRAICSTMIAETFQSVGYPILPTVQRKTELNKYHYTTTEILHIRHHSLFTPRDYDISPYFKIVKPTIEQGFDYQTLVWDKPDVKIK